MRKLYEVGGRQFRVALRPAEIPASREPGLRLNPQLRRIPAEMRAELTSTETAMSGSYFDDMLLRDPRRYALRILRTNCAGRALFDEDSPKWMAQCSR
jgi:hypothetical protein